MESESEKLIAEIRQSITRTIPSGEVENAALVVLIVGEKTYVLKNRRGKFGHSMPTIDAIAEVNDYVTRRLIPR